MTDTRPTFDGQSTTALKHDIERLADLINGLDDEYDTLREDLREEYNDAVETFKAKSPYGGDGSDDSAESSTTADQTVDDLLDSELGDEDHFLRHVTTDEITFSGRHDRIVKTRAKDDHIVHKIIERYADDAHGESLAWTRGVPSTCPHCDADLLTDDYGDDGEYVETAYCPDCPVHIERVSVDAPMDDSDYMKPVAFTATFVHEFNEEADWDELREKFEDDMDLDDLANLARLLSLRRELGWARDKAYDSDDGIQTVECGHCGTVVDEPAATSHAHYGDVCPDCEDVEVWSPDDADLPDDVEDRLDTHKSVTPAKLVRLLRDVLYYANYKRTNLDDEEKAEKIPDGIKTGRGGKIDAHGMGRGRKGTGLRRPNGAAHNDAHWRTLVTDAKETGLIERADSADVDDDHKGARWTATDKGREVFDELARCRTCGARKDPYKFERVYQSRGRSKKDSRLTLACADCDEMSHSPRGMTVASSTGRYTHKQLDGVDYNE